MFLRVVIFCALAVAASAQTRVTLKQGVATGRVDVTPLGPVTKFLGVPYAAPPVDKLRFLPPRPHLGWAPTVYDATYFRSNCMQKKDYLEPFYGLSQSEIDNMEFSEDCLHLNIYIPGGAVDPAAALPVMVWIHGGNFRASSGRIVGTTSAESPEALVISGDVIVVTINYRLGPFGFLTLGGDAAGGNTALMDQMAALAWVNANIGKFGGDNMRITAFGDGSGGTSINMHMYIEQSYGLFSRAAVSSGAYTGWGLPTQQDAIRSWCMYARSLDCASATGNRTETFTCLQGKPAQELLDKATRMLPDIIVDGNLLKDQPSTLLRAGRFNPVQLLTGVNLWDGDNFLFGRQFATNVYQNGLDKEYIPLILDRLIPLGYPKADTEVGREIRKLIQTYYFTNVTNPGQNLLDAVVLLRDVEMFAPTMRLAFANLNAGKSSYVYFFEKNSPESIQRHQGSPLTDGPGFGNEVRYIMGNVNEPDGVDKDFMNSVINAWSTFAATGKPKFIDNTNTPQDWPLLDERCSRLGLSAPLTVNKTGRFVPRGPFFFNRLINQLQRLKMEKLKMENSKPEMNKPEMGKPEMGRPEMGRPEMGRPEMGKPNMGWPEMNWPEMGRPETGRPEMGRNGTGKPEMGWPEMGRNGSSRPEMGRPEYGRPEMTGEWRPESEKAVAEPEMFEISTYVMLGFICLMVLLLVIVFGMMCTIYNQMRKQPKPEKFQQI